MRRRATTCWLSVTPEPERLLPRAVATLRAGGAPEAAAVAREHERLAALIRRARLRPWLAYLSSALALAQESGALAGDPDVLAAREATLELIANHHNLLLGLPGRAARATARERAWLGAPPAV